ncbi:MAG: helix-turn-helix transcriptional regulator [Hyphomicrobiaceae bacterium]|nr:helix-turn-helix transcriptional regulator [Hyphomicrobiaceae bacterium]MCC0024120.1 helix-turn-helix transcriptional regulator [Hyphomicrobiaceae bacterium]
MAASRKTNAKREISQVVPDPTALKALAHPDRLRMLGLLRIEGPATATTLANRMGLSSGSTSYHLRQLARFGFIEPADDLGDRRDRWWRAAHESTQYDTSELAGEDLEAGLAMTQSILSAHAQQMQRAHDEYRTLPAAWRKASTASDYLLTLNAEQAQRLVAKLENLLWEEARNSPYVEDTPAPGTRRFTIMLHAFPLPGLAPDPEGGPKQ